MGLCVVLCCGAMRVGGREYLGRGYGDGDWEGYRCRVWRVDMTVSWDIVHLGCLSSTCLCVVLWGGYG